MTSRSSAGRGRPAPWRTALVGLAGAVTLTSVLGACSEDGTRNASDEPTAETSTPVGTSEEPTPSESPTPTISSATPTPTATPTPSPGETTSAATLAEALLPPRSFAGFNAQWRWRAGETRSDEPATGTIADCMRFSLAAIGATGVATRTYLPPANASDTRVTATHLVVDFPDEQTAVRVMDVLRSWHSTCQRRLNDVSDKPHRVSDTASVGAGDDAFAYLHTTPGSSADTTLFEDVAQVRVGKRIALAVVRLDEMDYNYEPHRTPAARSLAPAAARLG